MATTDAARFWAKVDRSDGCWEWRGHTCLGYGHFKTDGLDRKAHRVSFEFHHGTIPDGLKVLHRCDNTRCVNPAHLFLGTQADNIRDMVTKGRQRGAVGARNHRAKLTDVDVVAIRQSTERTIDVARRLCVSRGLVSMIRTRAIWRHVA